MSVSRRSVLKAAGAGLLVAAAGGTTFVLTREPTRALAPWGQAGEFKDPRIWALSYAILAPNPHNRQPWLADIRKEGEITLFAEADRMLPETDPFNRQIVIGLGCFLEILRMAAAETGHRADIQAFPEGETSPTLDGRPIARIVFHADPAVERDPLFPFVPHRRSNKEPYDTDRAVDSVLLAKLTDVATVGSDVFAGATNDPARVGRLRDIGWRAMEIEIKTPRTYMESVDLMRIGRREIEANPDGIDIGGALMEVLNGAGLMTRETVADPASTAFQQGLDMQKALFDTAMAQVWVTTPGNSRTDQLNAGRAWVRINLGATELGVGLHPTSQALQEYAEVAAVSAELDRELGMEAPARLQMFGRLGYGPETGPSPRWPVEARLLRRTG